MPYETQPEQLQVIESYTVEAPQGITYGLPAIQVRAEGEDRSRVTENNRFAILDSDGKFLCQVAIYDHGHGHRTIDLNVTNAKEVDVWHKGDSETTKLKGPSTVAIVW